MKNLLVFFTILPSFVFAQGKFTEATLNEMNVRFIQNPIEFLKNNSAQGFVYINSTGVSKDLKKIIMVYEIADEPMREFSNVKIYQDGSNVYVEAILKHTVVIKKTQISRTISEVVLSTMIAKNGKWLLQTVHHSPVPMSVYEEEIAIKKVIQGETSAYYAGNAENLLAQWADRPNTEYQNSYIKAFVGSAYAKGATMLKLQDVMRKNVKKQDATVKEEDFEIRLKGDMAWATFTQIVSQNDKVMQHQRQTRILEKINGDWKIVFVSGMDMK